MAKQHASTDSDRFANGVAAFLTSLRLTIELPPKIDVLDPYQQAEVRDVVYRFCERYYGGDQPRLAVWGINPGRFGAGVTGLSFTDPVALTDLLRLETAISGRRELSAEFISMVISAYGGPDAFYRDIFLSALSPLGFASEGKNINFYDDVQLARDIAPLIRRWMAEQQHLGLIRGRAIVLGTGKLKQYVEREVRQAMGYSQIEYLEHPRFIMQYRRKRVGEFVDKYVETLLRLKG